MNKLMTLLAAVAVAAVSTLGASEAEACKPWRPSVCHVHSATLVQTDVPVQYGRPYFQPGYWEARAKEFPHAASPALGGCIVREQRTARALTCTGCTAAWKRFVASWTCSKHGTALRAVEVPTYYGLPVARPAFRAARAALFPHSTEPYAVGCCISVKDAPRKATLRVCATCDQAKAEWERKGAEPKAATGA